MPSTLPLDDPEATSSDHADAIVAAVAGARELVVVAQSFAPLRAPSSLRGSRWRNSSSSRR
jgi:hypothetical protein